MGAGKHQEELLVPLLVQRIRAFFVLRISGGIIKWKAAIQIFELHFNPYKTVDNKKLTIAHIYTYHRWFTDLFT
jgi:hypothetical protein